MFTFDDIGLAILIIFVAICLYYKYYMIVMMRHALDHLEEDVKKIREMLERENHDTH